MAPSSSVASTRKARRATNSRATNIRVSSLWSNRRGIVVGPWVQPRPSRGARQSALSLGPDVGLLDDLPPFVHLGFEKRGKLIRRGADHHDAALFELFGDSPLG